MYKIKEFIGTCSDPKVAKMALKYGVRRSYKRALLAVYEYNTYLAIKTLTMGFYNPWELKTNIKIIDGKKYLHIVHSAIDYLFEIEYE